MKRRAFITGLGPVTGLGVGIEPTWKAAVDGRSAIARIGLFDPSGFDCQVGAEVRDFKVAQVVPKTYRKATKIMARDIELAVGAADQAARDARLKTRGTDETGKDEGFVPTYDPARFGCQIGAGLIAADLDELTAAFINATDEDGTFDYHKWGAEGMSHLTPLWLLKYLPNMLACHVTIIHDTQGPSNTITCAEASSGLSIGESLRVIQRDAADVCFCGGADSKINPMSFLRQNFTGRLNTTSNDNPAAAVRPFSRSAAGTAVGEGGAIVILESAEAFHRRAERDGVKAYAEVVGYGASQSVHPGTRNLSPDPEGRGIALAIKAALRDAAIAPEDIDLIIPFGLGVAAYDNAEAAALRTVFGARLKNIPLASTKPLAGNCLAGAGAVDVCIAAMALREQLIPAILNCNDPLEGLDAACTSPAREAKLNHVLTYSTSLGGQNAALVLRKT